MLRKTRGTLRLCAKPSDWLCARIIRWRWASCKLGFDQPHQFPCIFQQNTVPLHQKSEHRERWYHHAAANNRLLKEECIKELTRYVQRVENTTRQWHWHVWGKTPKTWGCPNGRDVCLDTYFHELIQIAVSIDNFNHTLPIFVIYVTFW